MCFLDKNSEVKESILRKQLKSNQCIIVKALIRYKR